MKKNAPYIPARIADGKDAIVSYSVRHPQTDRFVRFRTKFNNIPPGPHRMKAMNDMVREINTKLLHGWNPLLDQIAERGNYTINQGIDHFLKTFMPTRHDSIRTYTSVTGIFRKYCIKHNLANKSCIYFTKENAIQFLAEVQRERNLKPRSYNNYMTMLRTMFNRLVEQQYCDKNPFADMRRRRAVEKNREVIPDELLIEIFNYLARNKPEFELICLLILHCGIRPAEICNLKPANIRISHNVISFDASQTKNKKAESVTVPDHIMIRLAHHISGAGKESYVFAKDTHLMPGRHKMNPRALSKIWDRMRNAIDIPVEYKLYSLKDTGATKFAYIITPKELKDQMRHASIDQTNTYIQIAQPVANKRIRQIDLLKTQPSHHQV